jgi:hypothetical protein
MDIPLLKDSIEESLKYLISTTLVLPEQMVIPYYAWYAKDPAMHRADEDTRQEDLERHQTEVEKSISEGGIRITTSFGSNFGEFAGLLHVRILEARKVLVDKIGGRELFFDRC